MNTLIVDNIYTVFDGERHIVGELYEKLSVLEPKRWFSSKYRVGQWDGYYRFFNTYNKRFPTGLLSMAKDVLDFTGVEYSIKDVRTGRIDNVPKITHNFLDGVKMRDYQVNAANETIRVGRGFFNLATNAGKTITATAIIKALNTKTLFLVHRKNLAEQARTNMMKHINKPIGIIYGEKKENIDADIIVSTAQSIRVFPKIVSKTKFLILDEVHVFPADSFYNIAMKCPAYYRLGMSGTPQKSSEVKNMRVRAVTGDELYRVTNEDLISEGLSAKPVFYIVPLFNIYSNKMFTGMTWDSIYDIVVVNNEERNTNIINLPQCFDGTFLILVRKIEHGNILYSEMSEKYGEENVVFLEGKTSMNDRMSTIENFKLGKIRIMIATSIMDEGVDISNINNLVLAGSGSSINKLLQRIGRALRKKEHNTVNIFDFSDDIQKNLKKQFETRLNCCLKEGFDVKIYGEENNVLNNSGLL